jgi:phosphomannomutase
MKKLKEIAEHYGIGSAHTGTVDKYVIEAMQKYAEFCCEEQKKTLC